MAVTNLNTTSNNVVVAAGNTLNILSGGTAIGLTNFGTVNGFGLLNSGGEVTDFADNASLMQASGGMPSS